MLYKEKDDETLVNLTLLGEQDAYEELVERWKKAVLSAAMFVTKDAYLAEDAAQDAFITAWTKLDKLQDPSRFGLWVRRIARNRALNIISREQRMVDYGLDYSIRNDDCCYSIADRSQYENWCRGEGEYEVCGNELLEGSIERLPQKIRTVIRLYYIEGYSIREIAGMLGCAEGTVKKQLYSGREKIRKDYEGMTVSETFVKEVMERVEKLKRFNLLNSKAGFKEEYSCLRSDLEKLPETEERFYAEADVLQLGWWYGEEKTDELLDLIRDRAERGRNEEVMTTVMEIKREKLSRQAKIDLINEVQSPYLEKIGFRHCLNNGKVWAGVEYIYMVKPDEAEKCFKSVIDSGLTDDCNYALAKSALECAQLKKKFPCAEEIMYNAAAEEWKQSDGRLYFVSSPGFWIGGYFKEVLPGCYTCLCDSIMYDENLPLGGVITGSDGSKNIHVKDGVSVETPMGTIDGCEKWICAGKGYKTESYFKKGIGIIRLTSENEGKTILLKDCNIVGGEGTVPLAVGNTWDYVYSDNTECREQLLQMEVTYSERGKIILKYNSVFIRHKYDENDFYDMMRAVKNKYIDREHWEINASSKSAAYDYLAKAEKAASTKSEKAHYSTAKKVMDNIYTGPEFDPNAAEEGEWNFFRVCTIIKNDDNTTHLDCYKADPGKIYSFEAKSLSDGYPYGVLCNFSYEIPDEILGYVWDDKWVDGYEAVIDHDCFRYKLRTTVNVTAVPTLTIAGEEYKNCLRVAFECSPREDSPQIRHDQYLGPKEYYYAPGVGIVRMVHHCIDGTTTTYDLTKYVGTGEGYFPAVDGMVRHYDAVDIDRNYRASTEYTYAEDENGRILVYGNLCGMKKLEK